MNFLYASPPPTLDYYIGRVSVELLHLHQLYVRPGGCTRTRYDHVFTSSYLHLPSLQFARVTIIKQTVSTHKYEAYRSS